MAQRPDTILHDMTSEGYGGSAYHHFTASFNGGQIVYWIAPRKVRILNARIAQVTLSTGATIALTKGSSGATIVPSSSVGNAAITGTMSRNAPLSTGSTSGIDNVVVDQYEFVVWRNTNASPNQAFGIMCHYAFED